MAIMDYRKIQKWISLIGTGPSWNETNDKPFDSVDPDTLEVKTDTSTQQKVLTVKSDSQHPVQSVNGKTGAVVLTGSDISGVVTKVNNKTGNVTLTADDVQMSTTNTKLVSQRFGELTSNALELGDCYQFGTLNNFNTVSGQVSVIGRITLQPGRWILFGNALCVGDIYFSHGIYQEYGRGASTSYTTTCFSIVDVPKGSTQTVEFRVTARAVWQITTDKHFWGAMAFKIRSYS